MSGNYELYQLKRFRKKNSVFIQGCNKYKSGNRKGWVRNQNGKYEQEELLESKKTDKHAGVQDKNIAFQNC